MEKRWNFNKCCQEQLDVCMQKKKEKKKKKKNTTINLSLIPRKN